MVRTWKNTGPIITSNMKCPAIQKYFKQILFTAFSTIAQGFSKLVRWPP